jgi:hypothetical protein
MEKMAHLAELWLILESDYVEDLIQMGISGCPPFHLAQNSFLAFLVIYYF